MSDPYCVVRIHLTLPLDADALLARLFPEALAAPNLFKRYDRYSAGVLRLLKDEAKKRGIVIKPIVKRETVEDDPPEPRETLE